MLLYNDTQGANISKEVSVSFPLLQGATVSAINLLLSIIGTFGNFLIIFAILKTPQLRQRPSNFLLLSLAVADLLVTMVAQPLFALNVLLKTASNRCISGIDMAYIMVASFSSGTSVNHLAAISIDRALATVKPHKHHSIMKKWSKVMLSLCWGMVAAGVVGYFSVKIITSGPSAALTLSILIATLIAVGFALMIGSYAIILYRIKLAKFQPSHGEMASTARGRAMEKRVSGTIAIVIFLFVATWFPNAGYRILNADTSAHCSFEIALVWIRTVFLGNSSMNFIIYSSRIRQFRKAYLRIINRILKPFRDIARKCFSKSSQQQNMNVTQTTVIPSSINTTSLGNEMQELNEKSSCKETVI